MNLDDLQKPMTAQRLATLLEKHHGIVIPVKELTEAKVNKLLKRVKKTLSEYATSKKFHVSEKDKNYTALILIEQTLNARLKEAWSIDDHNRPKTPLDLAIGIADKFSGLKRHIPGMDKHDYDAADGPIDIMKKMRGMKAATQLNDNQIDQLDRRLGRVGVVKIKDILDDVENRIAVNPAELKKVVLIFATAVVNKVYTASQINQIASNNGITSAQLIQYCNQAIAGSATNRVYNALARYFANSQKAPVTESRRRVIESAMADAEVVLAAKDIADRFQDMVESLGKMVNEELPALTETIRDTMGAEQAEAFNSSASQTINSALENIRSSKEALDSAARTLAGEEQPVEEPMAPQGQTEEPGSEQLDQIPASASGEEEEPLGRGKR